MYPRARLHLYGTKGSEFPTPPPAPPHQAFPTRWFPVFQVLLVLPESPVSLGAAEPWAEAQCHAVAEEQPLPGQALLLTPGTKLPGEQGRHGLAPHRAGLGANWALWHTQSYLVTISQRLNTRTPRGVNYNNNLWLLQLICFRTVTPNPDCLSQDQ